MPVGSIAATSVLQDLPRPTSEQSLSSVHSTSQRRDIARPVVPTTQRPQRVLNRGTAASRLKPQVLPSHRPITSRGSPVVSIPAKKINPGKHTERRAHPPSSEASRDIPVVGQVAISNQATSTRQDALRSSEPDLPSIQSTNTRCNVAFLSVPITQRPQTGKTNMRSHAGGRLGEERGGLSFRQLCLKLVALVWHELGSERLDLRQ